MGDAVFAQAGQSELLHPLAQAGREVIHCSRVFAEIATTRHQTPHSSHPFNRRIVGITLLQRAPVLLLCRCHQRAADHAVGHREPAADRSRQAMNNAQACIRKPNPGTESAIGHV